MQGRRHSSVKSLPRIIIDFLKIWLCINRRSITTESSIAEVVVRRCSVKKGVLKIFAILTGKQLCWSLFLIKLRTSANVRKSRYFVQMLRTVTLLKRD